MSVLSATTTYLFWSIKLQVRASMTNVPGACA